MKKKQHQREDIISYSLAPHLHLVGSSQCVIDGLKGILEYKRDRIKIDLGSYAVIVAGVGLYINELSPEGAIIEGDILSLELASVS